MAEKYIETLDESLMVIVEKEGDLEINGIIRLLANLAKGNKKPNRTIYLGKNEKVIRFSHWLSMEQVSNESDLKFELGSWINEH
jgi:hypothetical protein